MITTFHTVRIGNIIYSEFPVFKEIERLRPDAAQKLMAFFRMIGLGTPGQINVAIGNREDDDRIERLLRQLGVIISINEEASKENVRETEEMQKRIMKDDGKTHYIKMSDIAVKVQEMRYRDPEKAIRELLAAQGCQILPESASGRRSMEKSKTPKPVHETGQAQESKPTHDTEPARESESTRDAASTSTQKQEPVQEPKSTAEEEAEPMTGPEIDRIVKYAKDCPLEMRKAEGYKTVLNDREYLKALFEYFPSVSYEMVAKYLFDDSISPSRVTIMAHDADIKKINVRNPKGEAAKKIIYERASFVCWVGGDWQTYLTDSLKKAKTREAKTSIKLRAKRIRSATTAGHDDDLQPKDSSSTSGLTKREQSISPQTPESPPAVRHFKEIDKSAAPVPATIEKAGTIPGTQPIRRKEGSFSATLEISTSFGRAAIEKLIVQIIKDATFVRLDAYRIMPDE